MSEIADPQAVYNRKVSVAKAQRDRLIRAAKDAYIKDVQQAVAELQASTGRGQ